MVVFQVVQRWMNFAIANPARQVFFTVVGREEKYKAKNLIDVVVYRGSDALYGWVFDSLQALGLKLGAIALVRAAGGGRAGSSCRRALGRAQERRAALVEAGAAQGELSMNIRMTRREFAALAGRGGAAASPRIAHKARRRSSPAPSRARGERCRRSGSAPPTYSISNDETTRQKAAAVVQALVGGGGSLIDTASAYGDAETVLGEVIAAAALRDKLFIATKLEAPDAAELKRSLTRLKTEKLDLLQLHNVRDPQQSLAQFKEWKAQGVCRYIGITSTRHGDFAAVEAVLQREKPDFVQIDYSVDDREAEKRILPLAAEVKCRRAHRSAVRPRPAVSRRARQGDSRLGEGLRRQLGAVLPQISARRPAGDRGHPRHCRSGAHDRQSRRHARTTARRRPTPPHGGVRRIALAGRNSAILAPISACAATGGAAT